MRRRGVAAAPVVGLGLGASLLRGGVPGSGAQTGKGGVGGDVNVTPAAQSSP